MLDNAFIYTLDDIGELVQKNLENRHSAIEKAEKIIEENVLTFEKWKSNREQLPLIKELTKHSEEIQKNEIALALKRFSKEKNLEIILQSLARGLSQKYLHGAYNLLQTQEGKSNQEIANWIKKMYGLNSKYKDEYEKKPHK
tara:strand:- start:172 stop:597 length:426 start_codon:yes stop_codon:yes gene_type:complete